MPGEPLEATFEKRAAHADTVNGDVVTEEFLPDGVIVIGVEFCSVHAIGNQKNNLAALALRIAVFVNCAAAYTASSNALVGWPLMLIVAPVMFGASLVAECPLIDRALLMAALEGPTEGSSSRRVRFNSVSSLSWSLTKPLPS